MRKQVDKDRFIHIYLSIYLFIIRSPISPPKNSPRSSASLFVCLFVCFFKAKEKISRTREGRKGEEAPAPRRETLVFGPVTPKPPPPPPPAQFITMTALHQIETGIRPKGKNNLGCFCYICIKQIISFWIRSKHDKHAYPSPVQAFVNFSKRRRYIRVDGIGILITKFISFVHRLFSWRILC